MNFEEMFKKVGNSLGGRFEIKESEEKKKIRLGKELAIAQQYFNNISAWAGTRDSHLDGVGANTDHTNVAYWEKRISEIEAELAELNK